MVYFLKILENIWKESKAMANIIIEILIGILILSLIPLIYIACRNDAVCRFRIAYMNYCTDVVLSFLDSLKNDAELVERRTQYEQICKIKDTIIDKYSYNKLLFSLKPLKLKNWFTEEEIEFMNRKYVRI